MKKLSLVALLVCSVSFASTDDSAVELAAELFPRQRVVERIHEMYVTAFPVAERRAAISKAVDLYLETDFPWHELERLTVASIRTRLTEEEQKQVLSFLRSEAGRKFAAMQVGMTGAPAVLLERESEKLFEIVSRQAQVSREPNQSPQRNAGSRPSSGDSSASESPSSHGPRG